MLQTTAFQRLVLAPQKGPLPNLAINLLARKALELSRPVFRKKFNQ